MITHIVETKCRTCKGTGSLSIMTTEQTGVVTHNYKCSDCGGTGWEVTGRMIEVDKTKPYGEAVAQVVDKVGEKKTVISNFPKSEEKKVR